jgi:hypothetical protein
MSHCPHCNNAKSEVLKPAGTRTMKAGHNAPGDVTTAIELSKQWSSALETLNELQMGTIPTRKLHMMQGLRIKINDIDHLFFGPVVHDPDNKFNVQEIEDVGLVPMASVTDLLARTQRGEKFYGEVQ